LGSKFALEAAPGLNGRVWFKTPSVKQTIAVARCIEAVDENGLDAVATQKFLNTLDI
jgi:exosome complex component RRP40